MMPIMMAMAMPLRTTSRGMMSIANDINGEESNSGIVDSNRIDVENYNSGIDDRDDDHSDERRKGRIVQTNQDEVQNRAKLGIES
jgi:hypothetical protein